MIQANAKCVVNGKKLNELISWVNSSMEQLDVVDQNNYASKRWFLVSDASDINSGTSPDASRDKMQREGGGGGGGGAQGNRDKLNKAAGGGQGVKIKNGGALRDDGTTTAKRKGAFGGGTDAFGNELYADGTRVTPGGMGGALRDDGTTTRTGTQPSGALRDDGFTTRTEPQPSGALRDDGFTTRTPDTTPLPGAPPRTAEPPIAKSRSGSPSGRSEAMRRANQREARRNKRNTLQTRLMDEATKKRQAEADKMAFANKYG